MSVITKKKSVEITPPGFDTRFCCDNHYSYLFELETEKENRKPNNHGTEQTIWKIAMFHMHLCVYVHTYIWQLYSEKILLGIVQREREWF